MLKKSLYSVLFLFVCFSSPVFAAKQKIQLEAKLMEGGPILANGVEWRVYGADAVAAGTSKELYYSFGGSKTFEMDTGEYLVHAAFGHAGAVKKISVGGSQLKEEFILDAGALKLSATAFPDAPIPARLLRFDIYGDSIDSTGNRKLLAHNVKPSEIIAFPVGTYHVVSRFGDLNATVRADLRVQLGKLTEATLQHRAAIITLRLVRKLGGDAVADTAWSILAENGEVIQESNSTFPSLVLSEGSYTAIAKHNDAVYSEDFEVKSGHNVDVDVLVPN